MTRLRIPLRAVTYIRASRPNKPYGVLSEVNLKSGEASVLIRRDLPTQVAGSRIISARLVGDVKAVGPGVRNLGVRALRRFDPTKATWANDPDYAAGSVFYTQVDATWTRLDIDVTDDTQRAADGMPMGGWRLNTTDSVERRLLATTLVWEIEYVDLPGRPEIKAPSGDLKVSLAKPSLLLDNLDPDVTDIRLQIATQSGSFTAPLLDWTTTDVDGILNTADATWAGLANNGLFMARALQKNPAGWSKPGLPVTFGRVAKPAGAPVVTVAAGDPTPEISWSDPGVPQVAADLFTKSLLLRGRNVTHETLTTQTAFEGPYVYPFDLPHEAVVRTYDRPDRAWTPGDPPFREGRTPFTVTQSETIAPPTGLTWRMSGDSPQVILEWTRDNEPDEWFVNIGSGRHYRLDADEYKIGPGRWAFPTWYVTPNTDSVIRIRPIAGGVSGRAGEFTVHPTFTKICLVDPSDGLRFYVLGTGTGDRGRYAEVIQRHVTLGGSRVSFRISAQRGLEDRRVEHLIAHGADGMTDAEQVANLWELKERARTKPLRLIYADLNIPVTVRDLQALVNENASTTDLIRHDAAFTADQSGELPFPAIVWGE